MQCNISLIGPSRILPNLLDNRNHWKKNPARLEVFDSQGTQNTETATQTYSTENGADEKPFLKCSSSI